MILNALYDSLLGFSEKVFTAIVFRILTVRSRRADARENSKQDHDMDRDENSKGGRGHE